MIKVEKDLKSIPASLNSRLTNQRRDEVIAAKEYPSSLKKLNANPIFEVKTTSPYDDRYKYEDVKKRLETIYNYKCAYCEQRVEGYHVEHYRPKNIYYWLAYSWDNLLLCCPYCNTHKSDNFEVQDRVTFNKLPTDNIHKLRDVYDNYEKPSLINPEKENIYAHLKFKKDGSVSSTKIRVKHTIEIIKIHRTYLNERRFSLYNDFEKKVTSRLEEHKFGNTEALIKLKGLIEDFVTDSNNPIKEFLSFRKYIIKHWLKDLVKDLTS